VRLGEGTCDRLSPGIARFAYDRQAQRVGIVHFGIGAFHRAHQAWYTDLAMDAGDADWMIAGVSLRSDAVAQQLNPQGGFYTLTARSGAQQDTRLIGAVREVLFAPEEAQSIVDRIASPDCRIVSFTVTEKGYARAEDGSLDLAAASASFYPPLTQGLRLRMERGLPGVTLLSCDNIAANGRVLAALMADWMESECPDLLDWFRSTCTVPSTMIDRIVPRSTPEDLATLELRIGLEDRGAVFTERFSQWVIEDEFANGRPRWEVAGAQLVEDVAPYETAKLRMLNGAHSLLAYAGLRAGYEFVHEAIADPALRKSTQELMYQAASTIAAPADLDLAAYARELVDRFADRALRHRLSQIAMDGTQKLPQRWLDTARHLQRAGAPATFLPEALDAWIWHLSDGRFVEDPAGEELSALVRSGKRAVIQRCFCGRSERPPLWQGYTELVPLLLQESPPC
jgi:fructuronate reductase